MSRCIFVCDNIRRNKFNKVSQYRHAADSDDLSKEIMIGRVFEYLELKQNFKGNCIWDREFDVDECMVEDFGSSQIQRNQLGLGISFDTLISH